MGVALMLRLSEAAAEDHAVPAWVFGLAAFAGLVVALLVVSRFNPDR